MHIFRFYHRDVNWRVAACYALDAFSNTVSVYFTDGTFERGDDFAVAEARVERDENDVVVRLVVDPSTIRTGVDAIERDEEGFRDAQASMVSYRVVPQPDVEVVLGED